MATLLPAALLLSLAHLRLCTDWHTAITAGLLPLCSARDFLQARSQEIREMVVYTGKVVVPFAKPRVWALMSDWTNLAAWDMNITRSEREAGQAEGDAVDTRFDCTFSLNGRVSQVAYVCREWAAGETCAFEGVARLAPLVGVRSRDRIVCREVEGGTEVEASFDLKLMGLLRPLSFVMGSEMATTGPKVMKDIDSFVREKLEGGGEAAARAD